MIDYFLCACFQGSRGIPQAQLILCAHSALWSLVQLCLSPVLQSYMIPGSTRALAAPKAFAHLLFT